MTNRTYPYTAWTLTPSFSVKQVTLVALYMPGSTNLHATADHRVLFEDELHATRDGAIAYGWIKIQEGDERIEKLRARQNKRRAKLAALQAKTGGVSA